MQNSLTELERDLLDSFNRIKSEHSKFEIIGYIKGVADTENIKAQVVELPKVTRKNKRKSKAELAKVLQFPLY